MTVVLALVCGMVLPGLAVAVVTERPDGPRAGTAFLARFLAAGATLWLVTAGVLVRTAGVTDRSAWIASGVVGVVSAAVLVRPRSLRTLHALGAEWAALLGTVLLAVVASLPVAILVTRVSWGPIGSTPWYYWGLAQQVAEHHRLPATSVEWGTRVPFLSDYRLFTSGTAALLHQDSGSGIATLRALMVVALLLTAVGSALLVRALGGGRAAALVAVPITVGSGVAASKLTAYRPEAFGLGLALVVAACLLHWLRDGDRAALAIGAVGLGALVQVHGIAALTAGSLAAAGVAAFLAAPVRRSVIRAGVAASCCVAAVGVLRLAFGVGATAVNPGGLSDTGGLTDPTWGFMRAIIARPPSTPPSNLDIARGALASIYPGGLDSQWLLAVAALATITLVVGAFRTIRCRRMLGFHVVALILLAAGVLVFALGWEGYVPRRTGSQRILIEATVLVGPVVGCAAAVVCDRLRGRWRTTSVVVAIVLATVVGTAADAAFRDSMSDRHPGQSDFDALSALHIAPGDVLLTNAYTEGYLTQVTGAHSLLDGRAPYTFPRVLDRALTLLGEARAFFRAPGAHLDLLRHEHVGYVLVATPGSWSLGTSNVFDSPVDRGALAHARALRVVLSTPDLTVYRVDPSALPG